MFLSGLTLGVLVGGAAMYYIQPTVKLYVAKAFGWEAQAVAYFEKHTDAALEAQTAASTKT